MAEGKLLNAVFPEAPCLVWTIPTSRGRVSVSTGEISLQIYPGISDCTFFLKDTCTFFDLSDLRLNRKKDTLVQFY